MATRVTFGSSARVPSVFHKRSSTYPMPKNNCRSNGDDFPGLALMLKVLLAGLLRDIWGEGGEQGDSKHLLAKNRRGSGKVECQNKQIIVLPLCRFVCLSNMSIASSIWKERYKNSLHEYYEMVTVSQSKLAIPDSAPYGLKLQGHPSTRNLARINAITTTTTTINTSYT